MMSVNRHAALGAAVRSALVALVLLVSACATVPQGTVNDPLESLNRQVFNANDVIDNAVLKPVASTYRDWVPMPVRAAVSNFFSNIGDVYSAFNNLLQGKPVAAIEDTLRVSVNTVFGFGGLIDIASPAGLPKRGEDFGQTLGVWGFGSGPYVVLPLLGPSSVRDTVGLVVDRYWSPEFMLDERELRYALLGVQVVDLRSRLLGASSLLEDAALDKYSFVRDAYMQRRRYQIYDGEPPDDEDGGDTENRQNPVSPVGPGWLSPIFRFFVR